jgi:lipopolysaccharide/colanic/teichoic acid biosynthesis glycosyltransferase
MNNNKFSLFCVNDRSLTKHQDYDLEWLFRINCVTMFQGKAYFMVKRILDLALVLSTAPFWFPILVVCFFLVKLEYPLSPALFYQRRTGKGGEVFQMLKLRTMVPNAEALKKELMHLNELKYPDFKIKNDPRITGLGRILRKTSLDELPQLFNVIRGDMSLVGPRPTSFSKETYQLWHTERLDVIPGLTGLWQIYGRGNSQFDERLRLDILYIQRRSIMLDIFLLFRTVLSVLRLRGAY